MHATGAKIYRKDVARVRVYAALSSFSAGDAGEIRITCSS